MERISGDTLSVGRQDRRTVDAPSLTHEIERLLTAGIGITTLAIDQTAEAAELTLAQWRALVIAERPVGPRIGELASRLGVSVPSASRLVRRMERRGLVTATRADDDRRATIVRLTPRGRELVEAVVARRRKLIARALRDHPRNEPSGAGELIRGIADRLEALV